MDAQILDRECERRIHITDKYLHFVLSPVRVRDIAVAEAMCVIVTNYRDPLVTNPNFQLDGKVLDHLSAADVGAANVLLPARVQSTKTALWALPLRCGRSSHEAVPRSRFHSEKFRQVQPVWLVPWLASGVILATLALCHS